MIKGIFLDLDGTLLNNKNKLTDFTKQAIWTAIEKGYKIFLVTGKSLRNSINFYNELKLNTLIVTSQGQVICNPSNKNSKYEIVDISFREAKMVLEDNRIKDSLINYIFETQEFIFSIEQISSEVLPMICCNVLKLKDVSEYNNQEIIGFYIEIKKLHEKDILHLIKHLSRQYPSLDFSFWYGDFDRTILTAKPRECDKWIGVKKIISREQIDYSISFGNGWSDRLMLQNSDLGFAMKNSNDKVKDFAKKVTEYDNDHDGVAKSILEILKEV